MHESRGRRAWLLLLLGSLTMFGALSTDMYLPAFPEVAEDFGIQTSDVQLTLTSFMFGMGMGQVLYGPLSDRFGRKPPLFVGITLFIVASLACAAAGSLSVLIFWRFIQGLSASAGLVIARAFVRDHYTGIDLARTMTTLGVVFALGPALAPTVGAAVLAFADWHWVFVVLAIFGLYSLFGAMTLTESHPEHRRTQHGITDALRDYVQIFKHREFRFAAFTVVGGSTTLFGFVSSSPAVLIGEFGMDQRSFAILFGLNSLAMVVGSQINIRLLPKVGVRQALIVTTRIGVSATLLLLSAALAGLPLPVLLAFTAVITGSVSVIFGNGMTMALIPFGHRAGTATALLGLIQTSAAGIAAAALSQLPGSATVNMAMGMVVGSLLSFTFIRRTLEPSPTQ